MYKNRAEQLVNCFFAVKSYATRHNLHEVFVTAYRKLSKGSRLRPGISRNPARGFAGTKIKEDTHATCAPRLGT